LYNLKKLENLRENMDQTFQSISEKAELLLQSFNEKEKNKNSKNNFLQRNHVNIY